MTMPIAMTVTKTKTKTITIIIITITITAWHNTPHHNTTHHSARIKSLYVFTVMTIICNVTHLVDKYKPTRCVTLQIIVITVKAY